MRGQWKTTSELLGASYLERVAKQAAKTIHERVELLKTQQRERRYIDSVEAELIEAAKLDLSEAASAHATELQKALASERERYLTERERSGEVLERRARAEQRRIEAMGDSELADFAGEVLRRINGGEVLDVDSLDVLSVALKQGNNPDLHESLRTSIHANRLNEPWIHTEVGARVSDELAMAEVASERPGVVPVQVNGKWVGASLEAVYEDVAGGAE